MSSLAIPPNTKNILNKTTQACYVLKMLKFLLRFLLRETNSCATSAIQTLPVLVVVIQNGYVAKPFVTHPGSKPRLQTPERWEWTLACTVGTPVRITATAQLCRAFNFVKPICKSECVLLLSSGNIYTLSMLSALKKQTKPPKMGGLLALRGHRFLTVCCTIVN